MIRVWTAQHVGKLDLLRACLAEPELRGWVEERSSDPDKGKSCHICFTDRWTSIPGAIPIDYKQIAGWSIIVSRIEGMTQAADKAELERGLERCREAGCPGYDTDSDVSFFPRTWLLPEQLKDFRQHVQKLRLSRHGGSTCFIIKPSDGSEGENIRLIREEQKIPRYVTSTAKPAVAQDYLPPLLLNGKKFDLRLYCLITSVDPLEAYLHTEGLARFCAEDYAPPDDFNLTNTFAHLTNYSLNKKSSEYVHLSAAQLQGKEAARAALAAVDIGDAGDGAQAAPPHPPTAAAALSTAALNGAGGFAGCSKRPASYVLLELESTGKIGSREALWDRILELTRLTLVAMQPELSVSHARKFRGAKGDPTLRDAARHGTAAYAPHSRRAFHLIGVDLLIDSKGRPRLLEVNSNPSLDIMHDGGGGGGSGGGGGGGGGAGGDDNDVRGETSCNGGGGGGGGSGIFGWWSSSPAAAAAMPASSSAASTPSGEVSPVDLLVKRRVMTDCLSLVAALGRADTHGSAGDKSIPAGLCPVVGGGLGPELPPCLTRVDRCRRLYESFMRWASPGAGMDAAQFIRFAHRAALLRIDGLDEKGLEKAFRRVCLQEMRGEAPRAETPAKARAEERIKLPPQAFSRLLVEVARLAYGGKAEEQGVGKAEKAAHETAPPHGEHLEKLLSHIAASAEMG